MLFLFVVVVVVVAFSFTHTHTDNNVHTRDDVSGTFNVCCCFWFFFRCFTNVAFTTKVKYELIARQKYLSDTMNETRNSAIHVAVDVAANRSSGRAWESQTERAKSTNAANVIPVFAANSHSVGSVCSVVLRERGCSQAKRAAIACLISLFKFFDLAV